jgi:cell fate (sporulation/competence/biofilm development) regulator YmcA (YheA/YmcA/DUF963 family)
MKEKKGFLNSLLNQTRKLIVTYSSGKQTDKLEKAASSATPTRKRIEYQPQIRKYYSIKKPNEVTNIIKMHTSTCYTNSNNKKKTNGF